VTAGGPGLVAVGSDMAAFGSPDAAIWISPDGVTWLRVPHESVFDIAKMSSVIAGPTGVVAVGSAQLYGENDMHAAVWTAPSED